MKKIIVIVLFFALSASLSYYAVGYTVASRKATICEELAFQEAIEKNIQGMTMTGKKVTVQRSSVVSSISPFSVEVTYSVPLDLHATVFTKKFHVSVSGNISPQNVKIIYLL